MRCSSASARSRSRTSRASMRRSATRSRRVLVDRRRLRHPAGPLISPKAYRNLFKPFHVRVNDWIHANTGWKTFIHSCGSIWRLLDDIVDAGFDALNPVQTSAVGMDAGGAQGALRRSDHVLGRRHRHAADAAVRNARLRSGRWSRERIEIFGRGRRLHLQHRSTTSRPACPSRTCSRCTTPFAIPVALSRADRSEASVSAVQELARRRRRRRGGGRRRASRARPRRRHRGRQPARRTG